MRLKFLGGWLGRPSIPASKPPAAAPEDAESQFALGQRFDGPAVTGHDYAQAALWYLKAAVQGHRVAQFNLGMMYGQGKGVLRNQITAAMWLAKAAELGHAGAQYHIGIRRHRAGKSGSVPDASECRIESLKWLQLSVAQGYPGAESAREFVVLEMTSEEAHEGGRRAAGFVVVHGSAA